MSLLRRRIQPWLTRSPMPRKDEYLQVLREGWGIVVLTLIAEVTIYGETVQGKGLKATGNVQVTFADFPE